jgi:integrase
MNGAGRIFKRCGCVDATGRQWGQHCPRLGQRGHGSWYFTCSVTNLLGHSERVRHGGYPSQDAARHARDDLLAASREEQAARSWTLARWLRHWLDCHLGIRPTTRLHYTRDVEHFLVPHLGPVIIADLTGPRVAAAFAAMAQAPNRYGRPHSVCTLRHVRNTLRAGLNAAIREGILADNPTRRIRLPAGRHRAQVWTPHRIQRWQQTGQHPPVAVWTAEHLADFLHQARTDPLYALWWLIALRGLRRGEAAGLRWCDVDLDHAVLYIANQRTTAGYQVIEGPTQSEASNRAVALDRASVTGLRDQLHRQQQARQHDGRRWTDTGYVFTGPTGQAIHPGYATHRFHTLIQRYGLPPIRLHDLRHGAASLAHQAGADLKSIQDQLGHSTIVITADTYTHALPQTQYRDAEATAGIVLAAARHTRGVIRQQARTNVRFAKTSEAHQPVTPLPGSAITGAGGNPARPKRRTGPRRPASD